MAKWKYRKHDVLCVWVTGRSVIAVSPFAFTATG